MLYYTIKEITLCFIFILYTKTSVSHTIVLFEIWKRHCNWKEHSLIKANIQDFEFKKRENKREE